MIEQDPDETGQNPRRARGGMITDPSAAAAAMSQVTGAPIERPYLVRIIPGAPLLRIAGGVLLGMLAYTVVMAIVGAVLAATLWSKVSDDFTDSSSTPTPAAEVSQECQDAIAEGLDTNVPCIGDDPGAVEHLKAIAGAS
jgi:hypothetical protein